MAAGSAHRSGGDDTSPHRGSLPASDCAQHALAALPSASRFCGAGSAVFVWGHHLTAACCCCGYLSPVALRAYGSAPAPGLIAPALLLTALAEPHSLLQVV